MSVVYAFGETVYDIIFENDQPVAARAGGAMLNSAVSIARCGHPVQLLTELGDDSVGRLILDFLDQNGVGTSFIRPHPGFKTPLSLAFLDDSKSAAYSFYKNYPKNRLEFEFPIPAAGDIVLFGSFYSLHEDVREKLTAFLERARKNGALIIYDPNIRKNHLAELISAFPLVMENILLSDLVRGSDEDFDNLFHCCAEEKVFSQVKELGCRYVIVTHATKGAELISESISVVAPARKIKPVSTIGAGDSFNAGIIHGFLSLKSWHGKLKSLTANDWKKVLKTGVEFATDACRSYDNYISLDFAAGQKHAKSPD